jgi:TetR/AcrR family transcriptional regulator
VAQGALPAHTDASARAAVVVSFVLGRWLRFAKSDFKRSPVEGLEQHIPVLIT